MLKTILCLSKKNGIQNSDASISNQNKIGYVLFHNRGPQSRDVSKVSGAIYRAGKDGSCTKMWDDIHVSNGLDFSPDGANEE